MKLEAKNRLMAGEGTEIDAATIKEAAKYIQSVFAKHELPTKIKISKEANTMMCTQSSPFGNVQFYLELAWSKGGKTSVEATFSDLSALDITGIEAKDPLKKLGKSGVKSFLKFAKGYAKQANGIFEQAQWTEAWIRKFAAALVELNAAMTENKTKVGKEHR